jgi:alkylation response protein AidB-like acyl-CoA dehydrogenase
MGLAVAEEHDDLARTVARWVAERCPPAVARAALEADPAEAPPVWKELADQGWLGLAVPESRGGEGFGLTEVAVVLSELARGVVPGPVLPTVTVAAALAAAGPPAEGPDPLPGLADGSTRAGLALGPERLTAEPDGAGGATVSGRLPAVLGGPGADVVLAPLAGGGCCLLDAEGPGVTVTARPALDGTRGLAAVEVDRAPVPPGRLLAGLNQGTVEGLAAVLAAAEGAGVARWCLETASDYARVRVQFGRPIGQFQAVKHKLSDMLVAAEQADAVAWDAAGSWDQVAGAGPDDEQRLTAAVAASVALEAACTCAKACVQILGGIGFTWEHDAHLFLKRAVAARALLGSADGHDEVVARLALGGVRRAMTAELPAEAEERRAALAPLVAEAAALGGTEQRAFLVDHGLVAPHWPPPWGRGADALEQVVLDEELAAAGVRRPHLGIGAWALPTLIGHGDAGQQARWVRPTLMGELSWCQLFSEPGAGSDLASLATRAERVDGGWRLSGQKVWTSLAQTADWGICLARTDPSVPKHEGITYFVVDMRTPGIDIRPLRELTGEAMFNEVFLDGVVVPDECVIGAPGGGWPIARTTLANERVSMASGSAFGIGVEQVLRQLARLGPGATPAEVLAVGRLLSEAQSLGLLGHRATLRALSGTDPGAGASVRKLLGAEHEQRVQELGLELCATEGAVTEDRAGRWSRGFLATRCLTIAGGTSEVQRNVIAERLLGQPRDPEPA